jgi:hypothetical protein
MQGGQLGGQTAAGGQGLGPGGVAGRVASHQARPEVASAAGDMVAITANLGVEDQVEYHKRRERDEADSRSVPRSTQPSEPARRYLVS